MTTFFAIPTAWMMPNDQVAVYIESKTNNDGQSSKTGSLEIKSVHVTHKTSEYFYVDQGLKTDDQIITTPIQSPEVGMLLRRIDMKSMKTSQVVEVKP